MGQFDGFKEERVFFVTTVVRVEAANEAEAKTIAISGKGDVISFDADEEEA